MTATDRLDTIEARANAATGGPWSVGAMFADTIVGPTYADADGYPDRAILAEHVSGDDAEFIAAARTDVPALVAALRGVLALDVETIAIGLALSLWSQAVAPRGGLAWHAAESVAARIEDAITAALTEVSA